MCSSRRTLAPEGLAGDFVALSVADTGSGIPPDLLSRVVEPFFTTKGPDKGTGLGLSQVYGFARRSDGTVSIDSEVGRGTKVTVYLPRSHAAFAAPSPEDNGQYVSDRPADHPGRGGQSPRSGTSRCRCWSSSATGRSKRKHAAAALDMLAAGKSVALVFSDVVLPGRTDGLALARIVGERYPEFRWC